MQKRNIYIIQFGTGTNINLLPLAAGQLYSSLRQDRLLSKECSCPEIIFKRPLSVKALVSGLSNVFVAGLSSFQWNLRLNLQAAEAIKEKFPNALIVFGGPSVPRDQDFSEPFLKQYPFIDLICTGEGEEIFVDLCRQHLEKMDFSSIAGLIYRDRKQHAIIRTTTEQPPLLERLPSPYLDGTFSQLYKKYGREISGTILETSRGCPYQCTYCTWGNFSYRLLREKPLALIKEEIKWIAQHKIGYIAMTDANFGITERDVRIAQLLSESKEKFDAPRSMSLNWMRQPSANLLQAAEMFKRSGIVVKVTLALQSFNNQALRAVRRNNITKSVFENARRQYHQRRYYFYTELILGLPQETHASFLSGLEKSFSNSIYEQLYLYPLFLFPNTEIASKESREKYGLITRVIPNRYTKSKEYMPLKEKVEIVVGTRTMPEKEWVNAFVIGYYALALHYNRLCFFIFHYLKKKYRVKHTELISFARQGCITYKLPTLRRSFLRLKRCARNVQLRAKSHLIEPRSFGGIPYDPYDGIFLELLMARDSFYKEFLLITKAHLAARRIAFDEVELKDLFIFQEAVMAHPDGPADEELHLRYDWVSYFLFAFQLEAKALTLCRRKLKVVDIHPCNGDRKEFLKHHFDVRGVPAFNQLVDRDGTPVFPLMDSMK